MARSKTTGQPGGGTTLFDRRCLSRPVHVVRCENCVFFNRAAWIKGGMDLCRNPDNQKRFIPPGVELPCFVRKGSKQEVEYFVRK